MRGISIYALVILFSISIFSCQEKEDLSANQLEGLYESREFIDSLELWTVSTYKFAPNGSYEFWITMRSSETGSDLGYRRFLKGEYQWDGLTLSYQPENGDGLPFGSPELYRPKSQLESFDNYVFDYFRALKAKLEFSSSKEIMVYQEIYPDTWPEVNQEESRTFIRVSR